MAKIHLDRLRRKYGFTGKKYKELLQTILAQNSLNISNNLARMSKDNYVKAAKKVSTKEKRFIVPDVSDVLPKRAVFTRKAAIDGKRLNDKLRDSLTKNLRETLMQFTPKTGEATYTYRRGVNAGRTNPKLIAHFEDQIQQTFEGYVKKDPSYNMPRNVHSIAVTEVRSVSDEIKYAYMLQIKKRNPDFNIKKKWIHNSSLSKVSRKSHTKLHGKIIPFDQLFVYESDNGGTVRLRYPHDPLAPVGEIISCHCDFDIIIVKIK